MNAPNPYAFPWTEDDGSQNTGMTLRDYFAAKAMQSLVTYPRELTDKELSEWAYAIADAMLAERIRT
jgi:hypothetical protein